MNNSVNAFAKNAMTQFGLSETIAKKYMGTFGAMSKSFGFTEKQAYGMSATLTGLAGDVASFYNISTDEAYTKLKSVYTGETESLKELGVVMTENALNQFALQKGIKKTTQQMSEQEKVALRYMFVQEKLRLAQGDFSKTSDSWANQTRILKLNFDALKASIGQGLINVLTPVVKWLNIILIKLKAVADGFAKFTSKFNKTGNKNNGTASIAGDIASADSNMTDLNKTAKEVKKSLMGFDEINSLADMSKGAEGLNDSILDNVDFSAPDMDMKNPFGGMKIPPNLDKDMGKLKASSDRLWESLKRVGSFTWEGLKDFYNRALVPIGKWTLGEGLPRFMDITSNGLNNTDFGRLNESLRNLWDALVPFMTKGIGTGLLDFYELCLVPLGQWTIGEGLPRLNDAFAKLFNNIDYDKINSAFRELWTSLSKFGGVIGDGLLKFIENVLEPLLEWAINNVVPPVIKSLAIAFDILRGVIKVLQPIFKVLWEEVLKPLGQWTGDLVIKALDLVTRGLQKVSDWLNSNQDIAEGFSEKLKVLIDGVKAFFLGALDSLQKTFDTIMEIYNNYLAPLLDALKDKFMQVFETNIRPLLQKLWEDFGKVGLAIKQLWDEFLLPFISFLVEAFAPVLEIIGKLVLDVLGFVSDFIGSLIDLLTGLVEFICGVFTGDWRMAWDGIKLIFTGVWDAIVGFLRLCWQAILDLFGIDTAEVKRVTSEAWGKIKETTTRVWNEIKSFIKGAWDGIKTNSTDIVGRIKTTVEGKFNGLKDSAGRIWNGIKDSITKALGKIMDTAIRWARNIVDTISNAWNSIQDFMSGGFGGNSMNVSMHSSNNKPKPKKPKPKKPRVPKLATGGYVRANTPQLAMIGDNRHEGEIVAPESKIAEAVTRGISAVVDKLVPQQTQVVGATGGDITIPIYLDGGVLDTVIVNAQQRKNLRSGGR